MKFKWLIIAISVTLLLPLLAIATFPLSGALAQEAGNGPFRIEVSRHGFNNTTGEFRIEVEEGQEVEITFVYGDGDLTRNNPHIIFISDYNIQTDIQDRENLEVTVRFTAGSPGEINFTCILYCKGHENLQGGRIVILPTTEPPAEEGGTLLLTAPEQAQSGQPLTLTAVLRDSQDKPIGSTTVKFFIKVDFFTSGLMEIGEAVTNDQGIAVLEYTPRLAGDMQIVARHEGESYEAATTVTLTEADEPFYHHTEAGLQVPAPGAEVFIAPGTPLELGEGGKAPISVFRPPTGILSWLSPLLLAVMVLWATYFYVIRQVFRIPIVTEIRGTDTRLVPLVGLAIVVMLGIMLVLMLVTGPYSHLHLFR